MTAYFDEVSSQISSGANSVDDIAALENRVIGHAVLCCGDREFPDDLREKIMGLIAVHAIHPLDMDKNEKAVQYAEVAKSSRLLPQLHEAFHEVARRRITTRFGLLTDDPSDILKSRELWEESTYGKE